MPWLLCLLLSTCEPVLVRQAHQAAPELVEGRILIDATPKTQVAQPGDTVTQRWIVAPDGEPVTVDLILIITLPAELPLVAYSLDAGTVTDLTCVKLSRRQVLCLANAIKTTNYLTTVSTVAGTWGDVSSASMLVASTGSATVASMSASVATVGGKVWLPLVRR